MWKLRVNMKYKFNKNDKLLVIQSSLMASIILATGCTQLDNSKQTSPESSVIATSIAETSIVEQITPEVTSTPTPTPTPVVYTFSWSADDSVDFAEYFQERTGAGFGLYGYVVSFGFTDELNEILTEYINNKYGTNYESVPFSKVSYFHTYIVNKEVGHNECREYSKFYHTCLNKFNCNIVFANKLVMSYLYYNQIPLGSKIPYEYLKALNIEDILSYDGARYMIDNNCFDLGDYDSSYTYSNQELYTVLQVHNLQLRELCNDERIKNLDLLTNDPEFPQAAEAREIYNGFLREYYGFDNCPQFGEVVTREQYIQIFGEEPLDLSYIPGAVVKDSEVKGSSKARYNDDINNYNVSYIPGYEYYIEETESTRSR